MARELSARDQELVSFAFQCMLEKPQIDYEKFATKANLKGAKSARDTFGPLFKRLVLANAKDDDAEVADGGDQTTPAKGKKKATTPRKRKSPGETGDGSPTIKKRTPAKNKKAVPAKEDDSADEAEGGADGAKEGDDGTPKEAEPEKTQEAGEE